MDPDSDNDGLTDFVEAFDTDGDGTADVTIRNADADGDGIDDAFDPDCPTGCASATPPSPLTGTTFTPAQDADADGTPDWLQLCGDAYTSNLLTEACDDGNTTDTDACNNSCLINNGNPCPGGNDTCASGACEANTCVVCRNDSPPGTPDSGCTRVSPRVTPRAPRRFVPLNVTTMPPTAGSTGAVAPARPTVTPLERPQFVPPAVLMTRP